MSTGGNGYRACADCGRAVSGRERVLGLCPGCAAEPVPAIQCGTPKCNAEIASGDRLDAEDEGWVYYREPGEWACKDCCADFERSRGS